MLPVPREVDAGHAFEAARIELLLCHQSGLCCSEVSGMLPTQPVLAKCGWGHEKWGYRKLAVKRRSGGESLGRETPKPRMCVGRNRDQPWSYRYCRISFQTPPLDHGRRSGLSPSLVVRGIHKNPG